MEVGMIARQCSGSSSRNINAEHGAVTQPAIERIERGFHVIRIQLNHAQKEIWPLFERGGDRLRILLQLGFQLWIGRRPDSDVGEIAELLHLCQLDGGHGSLDVRKKATLSVASGMRMRRRKIRIPDAIPFQSLLRREPIISVPTHESNSSAFNWTT